MSEKQEIIKFLSIVQHLGQAHYKTLNGFLQKPIHQQYQHQQQQQQQSINSPNFFSGDPKNIQQQLYNISQIIERANESQYDDLIFFLTKQLRSPIDSDEQKRLQEIITELNAPHEYIEAIGRIYQSYLLFDLLTVHCTEEHITKISESLTSVFPVPVSMTDDQSILNHSFQQQNLMVKTQNYLIILQKLQQLFSRTRIDSLLHLQAEINNNQQGLSGFSTITQQQICETLDMKSDEFFLATSLKVLLQTDETTLTSLFDSFPKFQSLQLIQLSLLPFKNIYDILDLKSNLCSLATTYQMYSPPPLALQFNYQLPDPNKAIELKIVVQPPEKAVYRRNVKPHPSVMFDADSKLLNGDFFVHVALIRCNNFTEEPTFLTGNKLTPVGSGRVVTFRKLKIMVTSHQQGETLFCFRFDLRRYRSDPDNNPNDFDVVSSIHSNPICVLSHSTQLKLTSSADLPQTVEIFPTHGPTTGGQRIALLGANFADTPAIRIKFDNIEVVPEYHSQGTLLCYAPEHAPGPVQVKVSNVPKCWSTTSVTFTYEDQNSIVTPAQQEFSSELSLPSSQFGLDFSAAFNSTFIIKGLDGSLTSLPSQSSSLVQRTTNIPPRFNFSTFKTINSLDQRGYGLLHYAATFDDQPLALAILQNSSVNVNLLDKHGSTPLYWACYFGHTMMVHLLLQHFASPNLANQQGRPPIHLACHRGQLDIVRLLVQFGADYNSQDLDGVSAIHIASLDELSLPVLRYLLVDCSADLYTVDDEGETALHYAVRQDNFNTAQFLLTCAKSIEENFEQTEVVQEYPFDLELMDCPLHSIQNQDGETPLHLSIATLNRKMSQLLLQFDSPADVSDILGQTPLNLYLEKSVLDKSNNGSGSKQEDLILQSLCKNIHDKKENFKNNSQNSFNHHHQEQHFQIHQLLTS
eukprot:gene3845-4790_t